MHFRTSFLATDLTSRSSYCTARPQQLLVGSAWKTSFAVHTHSAPHILVINSGWQDIPSCAPPAPSHQPTPTPLPSHTTGVAQVRTILRLTRTWGGYKLQSRLSVMPCCGAGLVGRSRRPSGRSSRYTRRNRPGSEASGHHPALGYYVI